MERKTIPALLLGDLAVDHKKKTGLRLKAARERKSLTQAELAARIPGLTPSRLGNYEQGTRYLGVDPELAHKVARVLDQRTAFLLCVDDGDALSLDERALIAKYRATDERGKRQIQATAGLQPHQMG